MKLAVISHTEHYRTPDGHIVGWGPTVRELNHLLELFEEIWHIAVLHEGPAPPSALPYLSDKIHFVPLRPFGGPRLIDKLGILWQAPAVIRTVRQTLKKVDWWQFRAPTGIGVLLIPYLSWFVRKPGWFKYAGNWAQENPPPGYRWQRFWLARLQKRKVTINGRWPGQPEHCLSFENPCLDEEERRKGAEIIARKDYSGPLEACFVGRLEDAKGVGRILEAFQVPEVAAHFSRLHLVGDGPKRKEYEALAKTLPVPVIFHGFLSRDKVAEVMGTCHLFLLPSDSEGFPKVVAEAANYGCTPLVSNVSSIPHYIDDTNGYLWDIGNATFTGFLKQALSTKTTLLPKAKQAYQLAEQFTFDRFVTRIKRELL